MVLFLPSPERDSLNTSATILKLKNMKTILISNIPPQMVEALNDFIQQNLTDGYFADTLNANEIEHTKEEIQKIEINY